MLDIPSDKERVVFQGVLEVFERQPLEYEVVVSILVYILAMALYDMSDGDSEELDEDDIDWITDMLQSAYKNVSEARIVIN